MRPVRLELKGFTAFRDEQVVELDGLDLFAIAGPTGSGKSSLLDAMTYALFGYVERVGKHVGQLVSQGQKRMAVTLEFAVTERRYRVTRSTPVKGATKIQFERREEGEWVRPEGSDRVRDADAMIREAIGLDYAGFTRSVLLPQGRFAEFLVGDAKDRRKILTDLLGLELFDRLARRVGELKRDAERDAAAARALLETEYAGVSEDAVATARRAAAAAAARGSALASAEATVAGLLERWRAIERAVADLRACATEAERLGAEASGAAGGLGSLAERISAAEDAARTAAERAARAVAEADAAREALAAARADGGDAGDLERLRAKAERVAELRASVEEGERVLATARDRVPETSAAAERARAALAGARAAEEAAATQVQEARAALEVARHADLVAAVRSGLRVGDACPVCGEPIRELVEGAAPDLDAAAQRVARAEAGFEGAAAAVREAERSQDVAGRAAEEARSAVERLERDLEAAGAASASLAAELATGLGGELPPDPVTAVEERIVRLRRLTGDERAASEVAATADRERLRVESARTQLQGELAALHARLEPARFDGLLERASAVDGVRPPALPVDRPPDAPALAEVASALAGAMVDFARDLLRSADDREGAEPALLDEAAGAIGELLDEPPGSLAELAASVADARRAAAADAATAAKEAADLRDRLARSRELAARRAELAARAGRFHALSLELRADRIVGFLQLEALQVLASAATEHLAGLSGGRYGLRFEDEEFFVVDTWNGEEARAARTLSGGETFLASLALALALSEQVRSLSVTERAHLDSLFLDEGFGTLDQESLEVVVEAIEQLGGNGRMVGVITHVLELAIRLPVRIDVEKSPRGSRLRIVT